MARTPAVPQQAESLRIRIGQKGQFLVALTVGAALALISWQAGVLDGSTDIFGGLSGSASQANNPGAFLAVGAAFVIGATMIVLPCGFPSVFAVPSILSSRKRLPQRVVLTLVFLAASVLPLTAVGAVLGLGGSAILGLLDTMAARMGFAVVLYSLLGAVAIGFALSELGIIRMPSMLGSVYGPSMPGQDKPYRRSLVLGSTMGAGMGIGCPMPTYYILLGWVAVAASPVYGAVVLGGFYGLGRVLPAVAIGGLIVAGMERRKVSWKMAAFRERTSGITNALVAATGSYLLVLFGGVLLYRLLTL